MGTVNLNLISLKCLLFIFFGGLGCLVPGLALAAHAVGLTAGELYIVSVAAPCVALLGPLIAAPLADRLGVPAQGSTARYGRYMRSMLVLVTLLGGLLYGALLYVPHTARQHHRNPPVSFICSPGGATVMQDQCQEMPCYHWPQHNRGTLFLSGCRYVCGEGPITPEGLFSTQSPPNMNNTPEVGVTSQDDSSERELDQSKTSELMSGMPRLCFEHNGQSICHIYTEYSKQLPINVTLAPSDSPQDSSDWCHYKILDKVECKPPPPSGPQPKDCTVVCDLDDPYNHTESLLLESACRQTFGDPQLTFWTYIVVRSLADIFPTTALALLASCLVVAARETPAILCRQLVYAFLGFTIFPPVVEFIVDVLPSEATILEKHNYTYGYYIITFAFLSLVSSIIILFDRSLPLSPVDYHVHLGPSHLNLRGAGGEIGALSLVLVLLGLFSTAIDSYIPWESVVLASIPSVLILWYANKIVDYCGHSNVLIIAFTFYIIRYTGLLIFEDVFALFLFGALEILTLVLSWSTAILYLRHLVPRHFLVTGQALAIIAFFCIGRCLGAVVGAVLVERLKSPVAAKWNDYFSESLYKVGAVLAAFVASAYFVLYHFCLKHKWRKQSTRVTQPVPQDTNANGTYTPLKIYNQPVKDQRIRY